MCLAATPVRSGCLTGTLLLQSSLFIYHRVSVTADTESNLHISCRRERTGTSLNRSRRRSSSYITAAHRFATRPRVPTHSAISNAQLVQWLIRATLCLTDCLPLHLESAYRVLVWYLFFSLAYSFEPLVFRFAANLVLLLTW